MGEVIAIKRNPNNKRKRNKSPDARNVVFELLLKKTEKERLAEKANEFGISVSDLLRYGAFGTEGLRVDPSIKMMQDLFAPALNDLAGISRNVNQIALKLNREARAGMTHDENSTGDAIGDALSAMKSLRDDVAKLVLKAALRS